MSLHSRIQENMQSLANDAAPIVFVSEMQTRSPASKSEICAQVETDGPGLRAKQVLHCKLRMRRPLCFVKSASTSSEAMCAQK